MGKRLLNFNKHKSNYLDRICEEQKSQKKIFDKLDALDLADKPETYNWKKHRK